MILTRVHRVFSFEQSCWLADYINMTADRRRAAKRAGDTSAVSLEKLKSNSIFGKTIEDVCKRRRIEIYTALGKDRALDNIASPMIKNWKVSGGPSDTCAHNR